MLATNPANPASCSGVEPYAITNMYLGPENDLRAGKSLLAWITGTAGWLYRCIVEYMAGVCADYDGLKINPCLPSHWKDISIQRKYRNSFYNIRILNPKGLQKGSLNIKLDGKPISTNIIPVSNNAKKHDVIVEMS